jgi:hypothetical protein
MSETTKTAAREFWIAQGSFTNIAFGDKEQADNLKWSRPIIHTIEYSAYEALEAENEGLKLKLKDALKDLCDGSGRMGR